MARPLHLGVLISGEGTTLDALAETIAGGHLPARIAIVVADRPHAPGLEKARRRGLPTSVLPLRGRDEAGWAAELDATLRGTGVDLVILAGFLAVLPTAFLARWHGRVINLHPSLLPSFGGPGMYGTKVHEAVLKSGAKESGASVHLVTDDLDAGPVLLQEAVPVLPDDTPGLLRDRVRPVELRLLYESVRRFADGRWSLPFTPDVGRPDPGASREHGGPSPDDAPPRS
ncbi:MAG: phosphoribosylglycinamide formyltransferase [Thermoplasmata archaeon]|nr:phosphoribosylglycinamide formyltransferase [Thermoplasmata archaeon]